MGISQEADSGQVARLWDEMYRCTRRRANVSSGDDEMVKE
jgi:hypothetical protein